MAEKFDIEAALDLLQGKQPEAEKPKKGPLALVFQLAIVALGAWLIYRLFQEFQKRRQSTGNNAGNNNGNAGNNNGNNAGNAGNQAQNNRLQNVRAQNLHSAKRAALLQTAGQIPSVRKGCTKCKSVENRQILYNRAQNQMVSQAVQNKKLLDGSSVAPGKADCQHLVVVPRDILSDSNFPKARGRTMRPYISKRCTADKLRYRGAHGGRSSK